MNHFIVVDNPEDRIREFCKQHRSSSAAVLTLRFSFDQYYLAEPTSVMLAVAAECINGSLSGLVIGEWRDDFLINTPNEGTSLSVWATSNNLPYFNTAQPVMLDPIAIPKPWGQEIWYTGIEERGQSKVTDGAYSIPLPWLLAVAPDLWVGGRDHELNLLKILDPLPEEVFGDLYFEQHEEKQEVYVVTHVDSGAWPGGQGGICIGFDPGVRSEFASDAACKAAFAEAVKEYEVVRREIDAHLDTCRRRDGVGDNDPVMANQAKTWLSTVPQELRDSEQVLRRGMDRFKGVKPLCVGDVLKVPTYTPHSLMHGVRTIEFQTPVYERQIIAFAQKVLTQSHWDTDAALDTMKLDMPDVADLALVQSDDDYNIEEVVDFDSFFVWRLTLSGGASYQLFNDRSYAIAIGVSGSLLVGGRALADEQAALIPGALDALEISNNGDSSGVLLLSFPK